MDVEKIKLVPKEYRRTIHLTVRVSPEIRTWLFKNQFSATALFNEAIKELGYKEGCLNGELEKEQRLYKKAWRHKRR